MTWSFVLTDRVGNQLGELRNASGRSLRFPLNRTPTFNFTIKADNPFSSLLVDLDKVLVKAYDDSTGSKVLRFYGPCVGRDKTRNAQEGAIPISAAGVQWRLDRRLIGQNIAGATFGTTSLSMLDRGEIMGRTIDALNVGESSNVWTVAGDTGIRRGSITASSSTYVTDQRYVFAGPFMAGLSATLDGPDYVFRPVEPTTDATGVQIAALDVAPAIGTTQPNVAFKFGGPDGNVAEWKDTGDATGLCNRGVNIPSGWPDTATQQPIVWQDTAATTDRGVLYEAVIPGELQSDDLRLKLVQENVRVRKVPKRIIAFTPVAEDPSAPIEQRRVPRPFADYNVGDVVHFRAIERFPVLAVDGTVQGYTETPTVDLLVRVFAIQIDLDDSGVAQTAVALQDDSG
jgi:hypothetical protein